MSFDDGDGWDAPVLEGVLWGGACVLAAVRAARAPRGEKVGWLLIAAGLALIVLDKAVDVHAGAHAIGTWIAIAVDPEHHLRGPNAMLRNVVLLGGWLAMCGLAAWALRRDAHFGRAKLLCVVGLALVGALVAVRLVPQLGPLLSDWSGKAIELLAWLLVLCGLWQGRRQPSSRGVVDGFL